LTASNQPVWSGSDWIGALFLTSAASTGLAVLMICSTRKGTKETHERLQKAEIWTAVLELAVFLIFLASLGPALFLLLDSWHGRLLVFGTLLLSMILPLFLQASARVQHHPAAAAVSTLAGGLLLRYTILHTPGELLAGNRHFVIAESDWASAWSWLFLAAMLILLAMFCVILYRRVAETGAEKLLVGCFFVLTGALLAYHAVTTSEQRREMWAALPFNLSPEANRQRDGGVGASGQNRPADLEPPSKVFRKQ
jgi:formate-dependent nitrite reductase membrane component NrfD